MPLKKLRFELPEYDSESDYIRKDNQGETELNTLKLLGEFDNNYFYDIVFRQAFLKELYKNRKLKFKNFYINFFRVNLRRERVQPFLEYFTDIQKFFNDIKKIELIRKNKCKKKGKCHIFGNFRKLTTIDANILLDPISFLIHIENILTEIENNKNINFSCVSCFHDISFSYKIILSSLNKMELIKKFINYRDRLNITNSIDFYNVLFFRDKIIRPKYDKKEFEVFDQELIHNKNLLLKSYFSDSDFYNLFKISIYSGDNNSNEKIYRVNIFFNSKEEKEYNDMIVQDLLKKMHNKAEFDEITPIENLIDIYIRDFMILKKTRMQERVAFYATLKVINFIKIFPLLTDRYINEVFVDYPGSYIYIDHQIFGRCITNIKFEYKDLLRIKTYLRLHSGKRLDYSQPIIQYTEHNKYFFCRFIMNQEPLVPKGFSLNIRKFDKNILTIQDILKYDTLSPIMAAFIYFFTLRKKNITATGNTNTGKTTLINAFDSLTPENCRTLYVEDTQESIDLTHLGKRQVFYEVEKINKEGNNSFITKESVIEYLLHYTPDTIYLGEILTRGETEAMFHCFAAGLKGFQTFHSEDIFSFLDRIINNFKISVDSLGALDLIISMKMDNNNNRKVISVCEVRDINKNINKKYEIFYFYKYNPKDGIWDDSIKSFYESKIVKSILSYEYLSEDDFAQWLSKYESIFKYIKESNKKIPIEDIVKLFQRIGVESNKSFEDLFNFWEGYKKNKYIELKKAGP